MRQSKINNNRRIGMIIPKNKTRNIKKDKSRYKKIHQKNS